MTTGMFSAIRQRQERISKNLKNGLCTNCGKEKRTNHHYCLKCRQKSRKRNKKYYEKIKWKYQNFEVKNGNKSKTQRNDR